MTFVTLEGIEGCGKSTQARLLASALGNRARLTREPGGTPLGLDVREMVLHRKETMSPAAEVLLFFADRAQHVAEVVRPALGAGRVVVCDRYVDSSYAYQGYGRGISLNLLRYVAQLATGGLAPDLTLFLDVPVELGLSRIRSRGAKDRLETEDREFHDRVRNGYLELIAAEPQRFVVINGTEDEASVAAATLAAVQGRLGAEAGVR
jgi:dTMP kinase